MRLERYDLLCWWENRPETAAACATRFAKMIDGLAAVDDVFATWRKQGRTRASAQKPFCKMPADIEELTQIFDQNRTYYDSPKRVWPELGFSFGCWNGLSPPYGASMHVNCGVFDDYRRTPNRIAIDLPERSLKTKAIWTASDLLPALKVMIDAWGAREAAVLSPRYPAPTRAPDKPGWPEVHLNPLLGWITFVPKQESALIVPPAGVEVEHTPLGDFYSLCEEPFTIDNPDHRVRAAAMEEALQPIRY